MRREEEGKKEEDLVGAKSQLDPFSWGPFLVLFVNGLAGLAAEPMAMLVNLVLCGAQEAMLPK